MSKRLFILLHRQLAWVAGFALICWSVSGILHPVMSWFGPQPVAMFPPSMTLAPNTLTDMATAVRGSGVDSARVVKLVPSDAGALLQVTKSDAAPRQYFSLIDAAALPGQDEQQARWLAGHYSGRPVSDIESVRFVSAFSEEYPEVNRLLPVYRVQFAGDDQLTAFIYTETGALASLNNTSKARLQQVFQQLHTWAWLDALGLGRVLLIALFMVTLLLMAIGGLILLGLLPARSIGDKHRRWHRRLGYVLWLPLLAWSASGFYHLIQAQYVEPVSGVRLGTALDLVDLPAPTAALPQQQLTAVSLVSDGAGNLLYRLALAPEDESVSRQARFNGRAASAGAVYLDATGNPVAHSDARQAANLLEGFFDDSPAGEPSKVTRFGSEYDFRNKRLPVWQFELADRAATRVFVDPATGVLVDQSRRLDRAERWSFSLLHKWNFLTGLAGREGRDALMVLVLASLLCSAIFGLKMGFRRRPN